MSRLNTRIINMGKVSLGRGNPIAIQSMTNTDSTKLLETFTQVEQLVRAGCEIIRISVPNEKALKVFLEIKPNVEVPLIADIHFDAGLALKCVEKGCAGVRINPGNIGGKESIVKIIDAAKKNKVCIRIGVNSGSLEKDLLLKYSRPTAEALAESALNWDEFFKKQDFYNFKISIKSSDIATMVNANRLVSSKTDTPLHIGLTEAGTLVSGVVRSAIGVGDLLKEGIGDTIRISLSSDPVNEVIAAKELLKALKLREGLEIISCPTCSRTEVDVINIADKLEREFSWVNIPIKVAVMGCIVNGPGEAKEADIGIAGGKDCAAVFINGEIIKKVSVDDAYTEISDYIKEKIKTKNKV
ncbi:MAG: flavodoxin-dependent (E)-4-hydroxy-3-methylbut-2-enyl-diphosphate synthase [Proteobacteria bacterium]|nr:flavodoxin-dependent (E)-4-hydroxy-3-methylbut-2-enyl-diphosphate synthase [Pseudomonadota bacterium]